MVLKNIGNSKIGRYYFPLISLVVKRIDNPKKVKANLTLKAGDATRFLNISNTPLRITIPFKNMILNKFDLMISSHCMCRLTVVVHIPHLFLETIQM